jgi:hypothetical protein
MSETQTSYHIPPETARALHRLKDGARLLDAGILPRTDAVEILAFDPSTGDLRDSATHTRWAAAKRFVLRNWGCAFSLRICAGGSVVEEIRATLGMADWFEAVSGAAVGEARDPLGARPAAQRFRVEAADVWIWVGVTIHFPGGRLRHVVLRDVRVVLVEPRPRTPAQARGPAQLSLGLGLE